MKRHSIRYQLKKSILGFRAFGNVLFRNIRSKVALNDTDSSREVVLLPNSNIYCMCIYIQSSAGI